MEKFTIEVLPSGEANEWRIMTKKDWIANIRFNGVLTVHEQEKMAIFISRSIDMTRKQNNLIEAVADAVTFMECASHGDMEGQKKAKASFKQNLLKARGH